VFPRDAAGAAFITGVTFALALSGLVFVTAFLAARGRFGAETGLFDAAFLEGFLIDFLEALFAADFFAGFFAVFFTFFAAVLLFWARFFDAAALAARGDSFFVFVFLEVFFLEATTNSFMAQTRLSGLMFSGAPYRVASASSPNTEKTSGFRSRL
jgi:hypothetical protein